MDILAVIGATTLWLILFVAIGWLVGIVKITFTFNGK